MKWITVDFGTHQVKMLLVSIDGQRLRIEGFASFPSKPEFFKGLGLPDAAAWANATIQMNELEWLKPDEDVTVISSLPSAYLETRYLKFPFKNAKKIEKILGFELEASIPFDIEEIQIRSKILEGEGLNPQRKEALVLAMAYKRETIKQFETELRKFQLSIPPVTAEILALSSLRQAVTDLNVFGIIEFGHSKTQLIIMQRSGAVLGARTFWWGGKNLIETMAAEMSVDVAVAQQRLSQISPEKLFGPKTEEALKTFALDLRQTFKGMQSEGLLFPKPFVLFYFGQIAHTPGFLNPINETMRNEFDLRLHPFPYADLDVRQIQGLDQIQDIEKALPALSMALAQMRAHRNRIPTFSETGFQFQRNLKKLKTGSFSILKKVALLLIAPLIYTILHFTIMEKENHQLLTKLSGLLQRTGFQIGKDEPTDKIVKRMRNELISGRKKIELLHEHDSSPLVVLTDISKIVPRSVKIDVKEFKVDPDTITMNAETTSEDAAHRIEEALKKKYSSLKMGAISDCASKKDCKSFTVEIEREKS